MPGACRRASDVLQAGFALKHVDDRDKPGHDGEDACRYTGRARNVMRAGLCSMLRARRSAVKPASVSFRMNWACVYCAMPSVLRILR